MSASAHLALAHPSDEEAALAKQTKQMLAGHRSSRLPLDLRAMNLDHKPTVKIPPAATRLLIQILDEMSRGNAVKLIPVRAELSTQEAAGLLNVSRPTLIRWLNEGKIQFRKVGSHRRVRLESAISYKRQLDGERMAALAELSAYDQKLGL
jgi:excisionase family DNA binding protein